MAAGDDVLVRLTAGTTTYHFGREESVCGEVPGDEATAMSLDEALGRGRRLCVKCGRLGVTNQDSLRRWAKSSDFERDFQGRVKGLGVAVYHWLAMRQGVDTVKPDVHVRRFAEKAVGRSLSDQDVVDVVVKAAHALGTKAYELDWAIWEASRGGLSE